MRSNTWRAFMLFSLTLVLVSGALDAQAARRSSLAGNQFIDDADDMFAFPQLTHKYKNRVILDLGQGGDSGSGSVVFGDNSVWNFNTGRGMYMNATSWAYGGTDRDPAGIENPDNEWWDLGWATHLGDTPFGVRFTWQNDSNEEIPSGSTEPNYKDSTSMMGLQLGTTLGSVDLVAELGFGSYKDETPGLNPTDQNDVSMFAFTLLGRGDIEDFGGQNWRWIAAFTSGSGDPKAENVASYTTTAFRGSFGPIWGTPGEWEVATYMTFDYMSGEEPNGEGPDLVEKYSQTVFPGFNMAMEYYLNSWFVVRGGVMSEAGSSSEEYQYAADDKSEDSERFYDMNWTLGLGVDKGNWGLDMALEEENVHSGYVVLNGDQSNFGSGHPIALLSAWLSW